MSEGTEAMALSLLLVLWIDGLEDVLGRFGAGLVVTTLCALVCSYATLEMYRLWRKR